MSKPISVMRFAETVDDLLSQASIEPGNESGGPVAETAQNEVEPDQGSGEAD